jgi:3-oxoacyl-[acyl-carrier protein] reductase
VFGYETEMAERERKRSAISFRFVILLAISHSFWRADVERTFRFAHASSIGASPGPEQTGKFAPHFRSKTKMDLGIKDRVAMVAAASKGIGKACALALAQEGCKVSICARDADDLEQTRAELANHSEVIAIAANVSSANDLENWYQRTIDRFGQVDVLVTNTGGPPVKRFMELSDEQWLAGVESTWMNVVRLSRLVIPGMQERRWGRIIHLTSLVAKQPIDELTISSALRAGLSGLTKTMANQVGPYNITVNAILTGHIMTDRQRALADVRVKERRITYEEYFAGQATEIPLRRIGEPRELGEVAAFLASERASYVTGVSLQVDGGLIRSTM